MTRQVLLCKWPFARRFTRRAQSRAPHPAVSILAGLAVFCNAIALAQEVPPTAAEPRPAAHFLDQATFGPTAADVTAIESAGTAAWLQQQFALPESPMPDGLDTNGVRNQLFLNMANGPDQLRQRMIFALSQIIVVSANKTGTGQELIPWIRLLSRNAFGNYRTLHARGDGEPDDGQVPRSGVQPPRHQYQLAERELRARADAAVLDWPCGTSTRTAPLKLDADGAAGPELYAESHQGVRARADRMDVSDDARRDAVEQRTRSTSSASCCARVTTHDTGAKTLFYGVVLPAEQSTTADMEAVDRQRFQSPQCAAVCRDTIDSVARHEQPEPGVHQARRRCLRQQRRRRARRSSRPVLTRDAHRSGSGGVCGRRRPPEGSGAPYHRPRPRARRQRHQYRIASTGVFSNLTQRLLTPQTVFSFYSPLTTLPGHADLFGPEFQIYPPALAVQRANYIYSILNGSYSSSFAVDLQPFIQRAADVPGLVELVNQRLMFGRMSPELRDLIGVATTAIPLRRAHRLPASGRLARSISPPSRASTPSTTMAASVRCTVQPPTGLVATSIAGSMVTLQWKPPLIGPPAQAYVLEAGTHRDRRSSACQPEARRLWSRSRFLPGRSTSAFTRYLAASRAVRRARFACTSAPPPDRRRRRIF